MADDITLKVGLDTGDTDKELLKIEKSAEKTGVKVNEALTIKIDVEVKQNVDALNKSIEALNESINKNNEDVGSTIEEMNAFAQIIGLVGTVLGVVSKSFKPILLALDVMGVISTKTSKSIVKIKEAFDTFLGDATVENFKNLLGLVIGVSSKFSALRGFMFANIGVILALSTKIIGLGNVIDGIVGGLDKLKAGIVGSIGILVGLRKQIVGIAKLGRGIGSIFLQSSKNLFGFTATLGAAGTGLLALSNILGDSDKASVRFASKITFLAGIVLTGLSAALTFAILKFAEFAVAIGTKLVDVFQKATNEFIIFERQTILFAKTIDTFNRATDGAVGSTESWKEELSAISDELNVSGLQRAAAEIVTVGSKLGLQEVQLKKLTKVVAEYSKITGKDVFDSSVAFVSALNGQSQSVISYGVKLSEASNQQFLLKKGIDKNFRTLSEGSKVQIRFNSLLDQYAQIAGIGAAASETLAEQGVKLARNQQRLNVKLGEGAALIEANNIGAAALNLVLDNINDTVLTFTGLFGALGARILQIGGFFLGWSFKIFAVIKVLKILDLILKADITQSAFARTIPILGGSIDEMVRKLAGANVKITNLQSLLTVGKLSFGKALSSLSVILFGVEKSALTASSAIKGLTLNLLKGVKSLAVVLLNPVFLLFVGKLALIIGTFVLLKNAFKTIEERTQVFSDVFAILSNAFAEATGGPIATFGEMLATMGKTIKNLAQKAFGILVFAIVKVIELVTKIAEKDPFGVFSKKTVAGLQAANRKLAGFSEQLKLARFDLSAFGQTAVASSGNLDGFIDSVDEAALKALRETLENVGLTPLEVLENQLKARGDLLRAANEQQLISAKEFAALMLKVQIDFEEKRKALIKPTELGKAIDSAITGFKQLAKNGIASIGAVLAGGGNAFKNFGKSILGIIGDILINVGFAISGIGKAIEAMRQSLIDAFSVGGGPAIIAGVALIALGGALKSLGSGGIGTAGGGGVTGPGSAPVNSVVDVEPPETEEKATAVTVNVDGTILDPIMVGQQIAEILDETFNAGASTIQVNSA